MAVQPQGTTNINSSNQSLNRPNPFSNIAEDQRIDRPPGSYINGMMAAGSSNIKSLSPAVEDFSWAKNISNEEYNEGRVELLHIPKIQVQIA